MSIQVENWSDNYHSSITIYEKTIIKRKGFKLSPIESILKMNEEMLLFHNGC